MVASVKNENTQRLPLEGVRVVDLTWAAAGPYCTLLLALLGAEVIKVETASRPGLERRGKVLKDIPTVPADFNASKRSISLNLKHPKAKEIIFRLCSMSQIFISNLRPQALERLGLGYGTLRNANSSLVVVYISAHGLTGPEREGPGYAPIFGAVGGAAFITGYKDGPPMELRLPIDIVCGGSAAFATLAALFQAKESGKGQLVEVANREVVTSFIGEYVLDAFLNRRAETRKGNEDEVMAPHNVYRCQGDDQWIAIAVGTAEEWKALCSVTGHSEWLEDTRFSDSYQRWLHREELDKALLEWCERSTANELFHILQRAGVPAGPSLSPKDLVVDPHLLERGVFTQVEMPEGKPMFFQGAPWFYSRLPLTAGPPPDFGEANTYVLNSVLGFSPQEIGELTQTGVVG